MCLLLVLSEESSRLSKGVGIYLSYIPLLLFTERLCLAIQTVFVTYTHRHTTHAIFFKGDKRDNQLFFCLSEVT